MTGGQPETTAEREQRLRRAGAVMCTRGGKPPTEADLDAVEKFMAWLAARRSGSPEPPAR